MTRSTTFTLLLLGTFAFFRQFPVSRNSFIRAVLIALVLCGGCYSFYCYQEKLAGKLPIGFTYPFGNPNLAGSVMAYTFIVSILLAIQAYRQKQKFSLYTVLALCSFALVLATRSKGAILATIVVSAVALLILLPRWRWYLWSIYALSIITSVFIAPLIANKLWLSLEIRLSIWQDTWKLATDSGFRVLFGWGIGNFLPVYPNFQEPLFHASYQAAANVTYPHCYLLEIFAELGVVGCLLFCALVASAIHKAVQLHRDRKDPEALAVFCGLATLLLHSLVSVAFSYPHVQFLAAISLGWLAAANSPPSPKMAFVPKLALQCMAFAGLAYLWIIYAYGPLVFHLQYKRALRTIKSAQTSRGQVQAIVAKGIEQLQQVPLPAVENHHTLRWRIDLGAAIVDNYASDRVYMEKAAKPFVELEEMCPKFGTFLLKRAVHCAKQGQKQQADSYFRCYAAKNPFALDLWTFWAIACRYDQATTEQMEQTLHLYREKYPEDGALLIAEAGIYVRNGQIERAKPMMEQAHHWVEQKLKVGSNARLLKIHDITGAFLQRYRDN